MTSKLISNNAYSGIIKTLFGHEAKGKTLNKFGRHEKCSGPDKIYYVLMDERQKNLESIAEFSFDNQVFADFVLRSEKIRQLLGIDTHFYMIGKILAEKENYRLQTIVQFDKGLSRNVLEFLSFMAEIEENPKAIVSNKTLQERFIENSRILKNSAIHLDELYKNLELFKKDYIFDSYLQNKNKNETMYYHLKDGDEKKNVIDFYKSLKGVLLNLCALDIVELDIEAIESIKSNEKKKLLGGIHEDDAKADSLAYFSKIFRESGSDKKLFSISTGTDFESALNILLNEDYLKKLPVKFKKHEQFFKERININ